MCKLKCTYNVYVLWAFLYPCKYENKTIRVEVMYLELFIKHLFVEIIPRILIMNLQQILHLTLFSSPCKGRRRLRRWRWFWYWLPIGTNWPRYFELECKLANISSTVLTRFVAFWRKLQHCFKFILIMHPKCFVTLLSWSTIAEWNASTLFCYPLPNQHSLFIMSLFHPFISRPTYVSIFHQRVMQIMHLNFLLHI